MQAIYVDDLGSSALLSMLYEIYEKKVYRPFLYGKKDLAVIDAGANIGMFSMYVAPVAKRIIAIEPSLSLYQCLDRMIEENQLCKIEAHRFALSDKKGTAKLSSFPGNATMNCLTPPDGAGWTEAEEVQTEVLSCELLDEWGIETVDFLKLDIEGAEATLLRSPEFQKASARIHTIVGEWHEWSGMPKQEFMTRLIDLGYFFRWITEVDASLFSATRLLSDLCRSMNYGDLL